MKWYAPTSAVRHETALKMQKLQHPNYVHRPSPIKGGIHLIQNNPTNVHYVHSCTGVSTRQNHITTIHLQYKALHQQRSRCQKQFTVHVKL